MDEGEKDEARRKLRNIEPDHCNQWNLPPSRYEGEHGTLTMQVKCGFPSKWEVHAFGTRDYSCDVHLAQAVRSMTEVESTRVIDVVARKEK